MQQASDDIQTTPLHERHIEAGARMVPFAGYDMPVQYPLGVMGEHKWTRESAGLFDVSHMGQAWLIAADGSHETVAGFIETLVPGSFLDLKAGGQRYTQLLNEEGGIIDDLMITRPADPARSGSLLLVVNAARKDIDYTHIRAHLPGGIQLAPMADQGLIALQGPKADVVLSGLCSTCADMAFMDALPAQIADIDCHISRSGYTGEDGWEISASAEDITTLWDSLLADERVKPIGLGARDSLRLEAGLCLYGHDIDETTSPVEAGLTWSIGKRRREEGGFPGFERIRRELTDGPARKRVGIAPEGRAPAREGTAITIDGQEIGTITSGGFGPTAEAPVAMGYVKSEYAKAGTGIELIVRGQPRPATVAKLPFVPNNFKR